MTRSIPGTADWRAFAGDRDEHRPADAAQLAEAVRTLVAEGWHPSDIARHLRLDAGFVRHVLETEP